MLLLHVKVQSATCHNECNFLVLHMMYSSVIIAEIKLIIERMCQSLENVSGRTQASTMLGTASSNRSPLCKSPDYKDAKIALTDLVLDSQPRIPLAIETEGTRC